MNSGKPISRRKVVPEASPTSLTKFRESKKRIKSGAVKSPQMSDANSESVKEKFSKEMLVEVSSDEDGLKGAWFAATIVEVVAKDKYLVQYESLKTADDAGFLGEEIDILHIRPRPPETIVVDCFKLMDEVDAHYNDAWWLGLIYKVHPNSRYVVYFKDTDEELVFNHSDLRIHQDWIDGKWITASQGLA
ncbi:hypothetical protein K2173_003909 [Erythroxylum novogranatense]|uniref:Agenet domain-containing protein n=1 Tax=Erythroxylum novogranatense TaxID=1862640 RepID=A0AAV8SJP0_9ROSI|nr:hypothetical protein K2173_003909 [Erythroxylum novogranatense]